MAVYLTANAYKVVEETEEEVDVSMQARQLPFDNTTTAGTVLARSQPRHSDNYDCAVLITPVTWLSIYKP